MVNVSQTNKMMNINIDKLVMKYVKLALTPFTKDFVLFMVLWIMSSAVDFFAYLSYGLFEYSFYYALHGFVVVYVITLIANIFFLKTKKYYCLIFLILGIINVMVDVVCHYNFHVKFTEDIVQIIKATNDVRQYSSSQLANKVT